MSITVRYGPEGAALGAAVQAGRGQDFWRRFQAEQGMVSDIRNYYNRQDALELEAQRLQQAARSRGATPTSGTQARVGRSPVGDSISQQFRMAGVSPEDQARLNIAREYGGVGASRQILENTMGPFSGAGSTPMQSAKQAYLAAVQGDLGLDEDDLATLAPLLESEEVDLDDFQQTLRERRQLKQTADVNRRYELSMQDRQLANQQRALANEAERLQEELAEAGFDPMGAPTQFNPQVRDVGDGLYGNVAETYWRGDVATGGNPAAMRKFTRLQQLQNQLRQLQQQREGLINQPRGGAAPQQTEGDVTQQSTQELLQQLLGG